MFLPNFHCNEDHLHIRSLKLFFLLHFLQPVCSAIFSVQLSPSHHLMLRQKLKLSPKPWCQQNLENWNCSTSLANTTWLNLQMFISWLLDPLNCNNSVGQERQNNCLPSFGQTASSFLFLHCFLLFLMWAVDRIQLVRTAAAPSLDPMPSLIESILSSWVWNYER